MLLESIWRRAWNRRGAPDRARRARGIITGGDRALIRSVESFEDYQEFGREQVRDLGLRPDDLFIAISEGGETSSVIGSAWQALDDGCEVFFVFNNPIDLLIQRVERSRALIQDQRVTPIDLTTGPMALSGSTRMQATTAELFYVGSAMEAALRAGPDAAAGAPEELARLVDRLLSAEAVRVIAELAELEAGIYESGRMVLYSSRSHLLDIFADTTERTPTFSIPPLKRAGDGDGIPNPWSAAYDPATTSTQAWRTMLGREPVGLDWDAATYTRLDATPFAVNPPRLGRDEILSYPVGREVEERYRPSVGLLLDVEWRRDVGRASIWITSGSRRWEIPVGASSGELDLVGHIGVKIVFNALSTATMAILGRIRGNWMVQVAPTNKKLLDRSIRIVAALRSIDYPAAAELVFREYEARRGATASLVQDILDLPPSAAVRPEGETRKGANR